MDSNCNFTFSHYEYVLKLINEKGYNTLFFTENCQDKCLWLRHDIDLSIENAVELAKLEAKYGVKSTFFVYLRSPFYNPFEKESTKRIQEILSYGHEIGLHFDEAVYEISSLNDLEDKIAKESKTLEEAFGTKIHAVSFHRPAKHLLGSSVSLKGYVHTYQKEFTEEARYIADSRGRWPMGSLCETISSGKYKRIHALLHPVWWNRTKKEPSKRLYDFVEDKIIELDSNLGKNIQIYRTILPQISILGRKLKWSE